MTWNNLFSESTIIDANWRVGANDKYVIVHPFNSKNVVKSGVSSIGDQVASSFERIVSDHDSQRSAPSVRCSPVYPAHPCKNISITASQHVVSELPCSIGIGVDDIFRLAGAFCWSSSLFSGYPIVFGVVCFFGTASKWHVSLDGRMVSLGCCYATAVWDQVTL